jgi:hypothetical protein
MRQSLENKENFCLAAKHNLFMLNPRTQTNSTNQFNPNQTLNIQLNLKPEVLRPAVQEQQYPK